MRATKCRKDETMNTTITLDEKSHDAMGELPAKMSFSRIARVLLVAATTDDKDWKKFLKGNDEAKEVQAFLRQRLLGKFD